LRNLLLLSLGAIFVFAQPPKILTSHWDNTRTSWNNVETVLTPTNVASGHFGKIGSLAVSGYVFAQPLFVPGVTTSGGQKDLLIVATMANAVYAFDANNFGSPVWTNSIGNPRTTYLYGGNIYNQTVGCLATPVVDFNAQKIYVLCGDNTGPRWIIHVLSLTDGTSLSSAVVSASVIGTGDPQGGDTTSGPNLLFYPYASFGRASLTLANGNLYVCFSGNSDQHPWHGWVMAYSTSSLTQIGVWCSTPNNYGGSIWMSNGGPTVDASGNLYVTTGNGTYDGVTNFADSVVKLSGSNLAMLDWFTPSNYAELEANDEDVSSTRPIMLPGGKLIVAAKDFNVYVIDQGCMGHLQGSSGCALQTFKSCALCTPGGESGSYGGAFGVNTAFLPTAGGPVYAFAYLGTSFNTTPVIGSVNYGSPGSSQMAVSSNGALNGIVWMTTSADSFTGVQNGTLRAVNPATLAEYWNSDMGSGNTLGLLAKFSSPVVAQGKVFVATNSGQIAIYGFLPAAGMRGAAVLRGNAVIR
jgi:hypothetical protein